MSTSLDVVVVGVVLGAHGAGTYGATMVGKQAPHRSPEVKRPSPSASDRVDGSSRTAAARHVPTITATLSTAKAHRTGPAPNVKTRAARR
jgi:hypothetical protein